MVSFFTPPVCRLEYSLVIEDVSFLRGREGLVGMVGG